MSKLTWLIILAVIVVLFVGRVVEVSVHPDRLSEVPSRIAAVATDKATLERVRNTALNLKREGEQWLIKDEAKQLELALLYIETDTKRLDGLVTDSGDNAEQVLPQAELLAQSTERLSQLLSQVPVDLLADAKNDTRSAIQATSDSLTKLQEASAKYEAIQQRFASVTDKLAEHIGEFDVSEEGAVAGTSATESDEDRNTTPSQSEIPLNF